MTVRAAAFSETAVTAMPIGNEKKARILRIRFSVFALIWKFVGIVHLGLSLFIYSIGYVFLTTLIVLCVASTKVVAKKVSEPLRSCTKPA